MSFDRVNERQAGCRTGWHLKAEHCIRLNIQDFARRKLLNGGALTWRCSNSVTGEEVGAINIVTRPDNARLVYSNDETPIHQDVRIARTGCNFGDARRWFMCPSCDRRVGVLFLRSGRFMCRHCAQFAYSSRAEVQMGRAWRVQSKLEHRLGDNWQWPKGMHHTTHERILDGIFAFEQRRDAARQVLGQRRGLLLGPGF